MQRSDRGRFWWLSNALACAWAARVAAARAAASGVSGGNRPFRGRVINDVRRLDSPLGTGVRSQISLS
ncbi:MAG: hypothetical protein F4Z60_12715 [Chloroflexi bacterium]|nr:hypothetical protein [Chloroflexota bacterium]